MNVNVREISALSFDEWIYAPQGSFGLGRLEWLKGSRILDDPGSLSFAWTDSSGLELVPCGPLQCPDALRGWSSKVRRKLWGCAWGPALKQGRPLEGGGSCFLQLAGGPEEHAGFREAKPPAPPGLSTGRDARLWRRLGCSRQGPVEPPSLGGPLESWPVSAGARHSGCTTHGAADVGL